MRKYNIVIIAATWLLLMPFVVVGIGFAGPEIWALSEIRQDIVELAFSKLLLRIGLLVFAGAPIALVMRSLKRRAEKNQR